MEKEYAYPTPIPNILLLISGYSPCFVITMENSIFCLNCIFKCCLFMYQSIICYTCMICVPFIFTPISDAFIYKSRNTSTLLQKSSLYTGVDAFPLIFKIAFLKNQVLFRRRISHYTGVDAFPLVLPVLIGRRAVFSEKSSTLPQKSQSLYRGWCFSPSFTSTLPQKSSLYTGIDAFPLVC